MNASTIILYRCILERYSKVIWSHKIQEIQADLHLSHQKLVNNHTCCLSVLITGGLVTMFSGLIPDCGEKISTIVSGVLSAFLSYFTIRYKDSQFETKATANRLWASKLHDLRNRYESLLADTKAGLLSDEQVVARRNELRVLENEIYSSAPHTTQKACDIAENKLKVKKESISENEEMKIIISEEYWDGIL